MLCLQFWLGEDRYALEISRIVEVLPQVRLKQIPHAPPEIAGLLDYRGTPAPVVDLSRMALGRPAQQQRSTRIVLVRYSGNGDTPHLLGLLAERVTQTLRLTPEDFAQSGVAGGHAPYLGPVVCGANGIVQLITVDALLTPELKDLLFRSPEDTQ